MIIPRIILLLLAATSVVNGTYSDVATEQDAPSESTPRSLSTFNHDIKIDHGQLAPPPQNLYSVDLRSYFDALPEPAIELILTYGDRNTHKINRNFFKIGTGYDSSILNEVTKTGWPTEFRYSNIIHHFRNFTLNFEGENMQNTIQKVKSSPTFILSSIVYNIFGLPSCYWNLLPNSNVKYVDLTMLQFSKKYLNEPVIPLTLADIVSRSKIQFLRIGSRILNDDGAIMFVKNLVPEKLKLLEIGHIDASSACAFILLNEMHRLKIDRFIIETHPVQFYQGEPFEYHCKDQIIKLNFRVDDSPYLCGGINSHHMKQNLSKDEIFNILNRLSKINIQGITFNHLIIDLDDNFTHTINQLNLRSLIFNSCKFGESEALIGKFYEDINCKRLNKICLFDTITDIDNLYEAFRVLADSYVESIRFSTEDIFISSDNAVELAKLFKKHPNKRVALSYNSTCESEEFTNQIKLKLTNKYPNFNIKTFRYSTA